LFVFFIRISEEVCFYAQTLLKTIQRVKVLM